MAGGTAKQKWEMDSRVDTRKQRKTDKEANWRAVCKQVDTRDRQRCRSCGQWCNTESMDMLERAHRHHMAYRSQGGQDIASNLITLCAQCHDAEHRHKLRIDAGSSYGADGPVEVWRFTPESGWFLVKRETSCGQTERD